VRQGVHDVVDADANAERGILLSSFLADKGRAVYETLTFKWIKQHLRIKAFYGTSENAVKTQIRIAVSVYVLVAIVRKRLMLPISLYRILQILSVTLFEKTPILQALQPSDSQKNLLDHANQLNLFTL